MAEEKAEQIGSSDSFTKADLFANIEKKTLSDIIGFGHRRILKSGSTLFREGSSALHSYLVVKGRLKLSKLHQEGKEAIVRYINPGEITAAIAAVGEKKYPVTAQSVGSVEIIEWDRAAMLKILTAYPQIAVNMLRATIERLDDIQNRYLELHVERVEQRIARALLRIMKQSARKTGEGILIDFRLSRQDLADYSGTTLFTVSRTLRTWQNNGWIRSGRERIVVTDPHALVAFVEAV